MSRGVSSFEGPRWAFGTLILKKTCTLQVYDVPPFRFGLGLRDIHMCLPTNSGPCPPTLVLDQQTQSVRSTYKANTW